MLLATRTVLGLFFAGSLWSLLAAPSDGQESQAKLAKAREALEAGRRREAERRFRAVVQKEPFRQDGYLGLAEAIAAQGRRLEAASVLVELGEELVQSRENQLAREVLEEATCLYPGSREAHLYLGRALLNLDAFDDASNHLRRAIDLGDRSLPARLYLGATLWESGKSKEAEEVYMTAVEASGNEPVALQQLGSLLLWQGRYDEAAVALGRAAALDPTSPIFFLDWGKALEGAGKTEKALKAYRDVVELEPEMPQARYHLGVLLHRMGNAEAAEAELSLFRRLHEEDQDRQRQQRRRQAELNQAWHVLRGGEPAEALELFRGLPTTPDSLAGLAAARSALGEHPSAVEILERAVLLAPQRRDLRLQLAEARVAAASR